MWCPLAESDFDGAPHAPHILVVEDGGARAVGEHLDHSQMPILAPEPGGSTGDIDWIAVE